MELDLNRIDNEIRSNINYVCYATSLSYVCVAARTQVFAYGSRSLKAIRGVESSIRNYIYDVYF